MKLWEWAAGKWPQIITAILGPDAADTRRHQRCPKNGSGTDRYRFSDVNGRGNYFCACSDGDCDGFELLMCVKGWSFKDAAKAVENVIGQCPKDGDTKMEKKPKTWAEQLRKETIKAPRSRYLEARGLEMAPALEFSKALTYYDEGKPLGQYPAMLAPVTRNGKFITYHVTYLMGDRKADVARPRKILPSNEQLRGCAIELYPLDGEVLGVAEGVETAIAAKMLSNIPVWALLNTSIMCNWKPPEGVKGVVIFGDHDENYAGHAAAYHLAHKLKGLDIAVTVNFPKTHGDYNDVLLEQKKRETVAE